MTLTEQQIKSFNDFQNSGIWHPYTCGTDSCRADLVATPNGLICEHCDYKQYWADGFMLDDSWRQHPMYAGIQKLKER